eukprot:GEMP01018404.1.p1 GENE.GEMP01018404.1~~GEMP01018404.1.p1  ORF type:complete len:225 (+),score=23.34 GEMP01018404.1:36-710(+)
MISLAGLTPMGPPSQYALNVIPRVKCLLVVIFIGGILRAVSTTLNDQSPFEGLMDLSSCFFGYFLFRNVGTMGQCSCGFMSMCFLNSIYDSIFAIIWFSSVGTSAFSTSGNIKIRGFNQDLSWRFPVTSVMLLILPPLQFYTGHIGYRMFKSMRPNAAIDHLGGWGEGSASGMAQMGMLQQPLASEAQVDEEGAGGHLDSRASPRDPLHAGAGFVPFAGPGQRL